MEIPIRILTTDNDDDVLSPDKIFNIVLSVKPDTSLPDGFKLDPDRSRTDVAIRDNEVAIAFEERSYEVREDAGIVDVCVRVSHPDSSVVLPLTGGMAIIGVVTTVPGTATENHYTRRAGFDIALFFDDAGRRECFDIDITDNDFLDGARFKEFYLTLANDPFTEPVLGYDSFDPIRNRVKITIEDDDDPAQIGFESASYSVIENREMVTLTVKNLSGEFAPDSTATVRLTTRDDSALAGTNGDYIATTRDIQLSSQMTTVEVTIPIVDNEDEELDKRFFVDLDVVGALPFGVELASDTSSAAVTILDGDATIGFEEPEYTILENGGQQEVKIEVKSGKLAEQVTVRLATVDGLAKSPDDYIHTEEDLVLSSTQLEDAAVIPINLDRLFEGAERFYAVLSDAGLPKGVKLATGTSRTTVVIKDEVIVTIGFVNAPYEVGEGAGGKTVTVAILSEGSVVGEDLTLEVDLKSSDMSALAGEDYQVVSRTVVFDPQTNQRNIWIPITDDMLFEGDEIFNLSLSNPRTFLNGARQSAGEEGDEIANQLNPGTAKFTITDNERPEVGFHSTEYEVGEASGTVAITFGITNGVALGEGVTLGVRFATADDQARLADGDYEAVDQTVDPVG